MNFHFQDYIGSARLDDLGAGMPGTLYSSGWSPFGDGFAAIVGPDQDTYHFAGLDADPDGTDHAQFRNYQPVTAQWLSPDPYMGSYRKKNPQSFNRYTYALNNPLRFVDPSGLEEQDCVTGTDDDGDSYSYCTESDSGGGGSPGDDGSNVDCNSDYAACVTADPDDPIDPDGAQVYSGISNTAPVPTAPNQISDPGSNGASHQGWRDRSILPSCRDINAYYDFLPKGGGRFALLSPVFGVPVPFAAVIGTGAGIADLISLGLNQIPGCHI